MIQSLYFIWASCCLLCILACNAPAEPPVRSTTTNTVVDTSPPAITVALIEPPAPEPPSTEFLDSLFALPDTTWVDLEMLLPTAVLDIRYATTNNFMELQVYDCPKCLTRLKTAKALIAIQDTLATEGLGIKFFDCYRPQSAQLKLWAKMPDRRYVAPPSRGSIHSRGGAVDITLVRLSDGQELEMGTTYDFFGREAYWSYQDHPDSVLQNRNHLRRVMEDHGFKTVSTEWWHYNYRRAWYDLSDHRWACE